MESGYLPNGQACYIKEKIGEKFVINKVYEHDDEEYGWQEIIDQNDVLVDVVLKTKPIEKISQDIKDLNLEKEEAQKQINELNRQKRELNSEIQRITSTKINNEKLIVNRSELLKAQKLVLFIKDRIMPITMNNSDKNFRGLRLSLTIDILTGKERSWGAELYFDYGHNSSNYLCEKYGILIDPTDEEVEQTIKKRVLELEFSDYWVKATDDKYLSKELIQRKKEIIKKETLVEKEKLTKLLQETKEKLSNLQK